MFFFLQVFLKVKAEVKDEKTYVIERKGKKIGHIALEKRRSSDL